MEIRNGRANSSPPQPAFCGRWKDFICKVCDRTEGRILIGLNFFFCTLLLEEHLEEHLLAPGIIAHSQYNKGYRSDKKSRSILTCFVNILFERVLIQSLKSLFFIAFVHKFPVIYIWSIAFNYQLYFHCYQSLY